MILKLAALLATLAASTAPAASPTLARERPAGSAEIQSYRFDLERNFFPSSDAEVAARAAVLYLAEDVTKRAANLDSPAALLAAFEAEDRLQRLFRQHDLYLFLRFATDIRREKGLAEAEALRVKTRAARQALRRAVVALDDKWIASAAATQPGLAPFSFWIETMRRDALHTLPADKQAVVSALEPVMRADDYPRVVNGLSLGTIRADGRSLDLRRNRSEIELHTSPQVRREGARRLFAGYAKQRDVLAYMLSRTIEASNGIARLKGYGSAFDEAAFDAYVTPANFENLLAEVARNATFYKEWQRKNGDPFTSAKRWPPSAAVQAITASAAPIGPDYQREYAELLDPANGRADLAGGANRLPATGTASVYPTGKSAIYMYAFEGSLLDVIVLAHEGGHAVQAQLMHRNKVPMAYAAGPGYFTESFGRFQELLLLDHLRRTARTPGEKASARDAFAARLLSVFPSAEEAAVELAIHKAVSDGRRSADDFDAATLTNGRLYSLEYGRIPERRGLWMLSEGYFMSPLHELNDAYSSLLSVRYFQLYRRDPEAFRESYVALLSNGFNAEPGDLLKRHLGIDMMAPRFASETMTALKSEVQKLYEN